MEKEVKYTEIEKEKSSEAKCRWENIKEDKMVRNKPSYNQVIISKN